MKKLAILLGLALALLPSIQAQENIQGLSDLFSNNFGGDSDDINRDGIADSSQETELLEKYSRWRTVHKVSIYGGGSLFGLVTGDDELDEGTSPSGSLGINFATQRIQGSLYYSYNGRQTVNLSTLGQLGNSLMNPNLSGQSLTLGLTARVRSYFGANASIRIADNLWQLDDETNIDASPMVIKIGGYYSPFIFNKERLNDNELILLLGVHYVNRSILGDFRNQDIDIEGLRVNDKGYNGLDISANAFLNAVHMYVQISINGDDDILIPGYSGTQVTFGINVTGNLISLTGKKKNDD